MAASHATRTRVLCFRHHRLPQSLPVRRSTPTSRPSLVHLPSTLLPHPPSINYYRPSRYPPGAKCAAAALNPHAALPNVKCRIGAVAALPPCLRVPTTFPSPNATHPSVKSGDKSKLCAAVDFPLKVSTSREVIRGLPSLPAQLPPTTSPAPSPLDGGIYGLPATSSPFSRRAEHAAPSFSPLYRLPVPARIDSCAVGGDILTPDMSRRLTHNLPTRQLLRSFSFTQNTNFTDLTPRCPAATLMLIFHSPPRLPASTFRVAPAYSAAPAPLFSNPPYTCAYTPNVRLPALSRHS
ncbi:hypothetical protein C8J57DRAFT_1600298 [Mycena rebaudengoi]|nr:hypothetical protein C8J57DRAFT_1600298 [Mycena rebaudengoi]